MTKVDDDKILLLDSQKSKTSSKFHIFKNGIIVILSTILVIAATLFIEIKLTDKYKQDLNSEHKNEAITDLPYGFVFVDEKADHGPITVDREKDDGTKLNIYDLIHPEDLSFYYNQENFDKLEDVVHPSKNNYFCEYNEDVPPEAYEGYEISCPAHYTIKIDYVFYGRHANDYEHCNINHKGEKIEKDQLEVDKECGNEPIDTVKEFCEGRVYCTLIPGGYIFNDSCEEKYKYLHVDYHCVKDKVRIKIK